MSNQAFSDRFRQAREAVPGLTKYELSKRSGIGESHIGKIERGPTIPGKKTLEKLAPHIRVPLSTLLEWAKEAKMQVIEAKTEEAIESLTREKVSDGAVKWAVLPGQAPGTPFPATDAELLLMAEAKQLDIWDTELDYDDTWEIPPHNRNRVRIFQKVSELIAEKRRSANGRQAK